MSTATAVRERPIIFSGPMIRAIIAGQKTQTRRVLKPDPKHRVALADNGNWYDADGIEPGRLLTCPFGVPGDRLWVREAWETLIPSISMQNKPHARRWFRYAADGDCPEVLSWRSPIFMPRWASRLTLEVVSVRLERLLDLTPADALAEGMDRETCAEVLNRAAGKHKTERCYITEDANGDSTFEHYCEKCAEKVARKNGEEAVPYSYPGDYPETDGPAMCDECGVALEVSLTRYGVERELFIECDPEGREPENWPTFGRDARVAQTFADGIGDLCDEHHGRLAQIGYATLWDLLNRKHPWKSNPWVWVVEFKKA